MVIPFVGTDEMTPYALAQTRFLAASADDGWVEARQASWPTEAGAENLRSLPDVRFVTLRGAGGSGDAFVRSDDSAMLVTLSGGSVNVTLLGTGLNEVDERITHLRALFPRSRPTADSSVAVAFWSLSAQGPRSMTRRIAVPSWESVAGNYSAVTRVALDRLMGLDPVGTGQLILWQGVPGTGKTWALRALASEWRSWADFHYITDPERFLMNDAAYMMDVLLADTDMDLSVPGGELEELERPVPDPRAADGRWRVLVMEDTGELMSADARERSGQGLSRLLNVADGLLGQGLRVLILVTTNEELRRLHPAVRRAGRCAARLEFSALSPVEAGLWWEAKGGDPESCACPRGSMVPVADLFAALVDRVDDGAAARVVGFA